MTITSRPHPQFDIPEIKRRADICEVWAALGGRKLRRLRGQAWWRGGDGYSVSLDAQRGLWHDHVTGDGGDVVTLVRVVRGCGFIEAADWLAHHTGVRVSEWIRDHGETDNDWPTDLKWAEYWAITAEMLAEDALASLPYWHPERRDLTVLITTINLGGAALVDEYRQWRRRNPKLTSFLAHAGQRSDARIQRRLALWLRRTYGEATT
jgi:hypothetical protein